MHFHVKQRVGHLRASKLQAVILFNLDVLLNLCEVQDMEFRVVEQGVEDRIKCWIGLFSNHPCNVAQKRFMGIHSVYRFRYLAD
ncbi:hypothetical protein D3C84_1070670 [compost metagenome]